MRYIIQNSESGEYATGRGRYRRGWTPNVQAARVFNRVVDAKNSSAFYGCDKPVILECELAIVRVWEKKT